MKNILYLTEESPFPAFGGGRIRRYGILKALSLSGYRVHAIVGNKFKINLNHYKINNVSFYEFNYKADKLSVVSRYFKIFTKNRKLMRLIKKVMADEKIDMAFLDCYFIGQYISFLKRVAPAAQDATMSADKSRRRKLHFFCKFFQGISKKQEIPVIFGTENAQSRYNRMKPAKGFLKKVEKYTNYLLQTIHERLFFNRADVVIVVSDHDFQFHRKFVNENKLHMIPNFLDFSRYRVSGEKDDYIVMTGSFRAYQNRHGLAWFLEEVWDNELSKRTKCMVAGYYSRELVEEIKRKKGNLENVYAVGEVEDINQYISQARIAIVPLLHGSGSRVKILEAMALRTLVISTSRGAEGIDHEDSVIIADKAGDFKNEILKVIEGIDPDYYKTKIEEAYQIALKKYSLEINQRRIEQILKSFH